MIITILNSVEKVDFLYLLRETGLTRANLSAHLSKLESVDNIHVEKTFRGKIPRTLLSIMEAGRTAFERSREKISIFIGKISEENDK